MKSHLQNRFDIDLWYGKEYENAFWIKGTPGVILSVERLGRRFSNRDQRFSNRDQRFSNRDQRLAVKLYQEDGNTSGTIIKTRESEYKRPKVNDSKDPDPYDVRKDDPVKIFWNGLYSTLVTWFGKIEYKVIGLDGKYLRTTDNLRDAGATKDMIHIANCNPGFSQLAKQANPGAFVNCTIHELWLCEFLQNMSEEMRMDKYHAAFDYCGSVTGNDAGTKPLSDWDYMLKSELFPRERGVYGASFSVRGHKKLYTYDGINISQFGDPANPKKQKLDQIEMMFHKIAAKRGYSLVTILKARYTRKLRDAKKSQAMMVIFFMSVNSKTRESAKNSLRKKIIKSQKVQKLLSDVSTNHFIQFEMYE